MDALQVTEEKLRAQIDQGAGIEIDFAPDAFHGRVRINGQDISNHVQGVVVRMDVRDGSTRIRLSCINRKGDHFTLSGRMAKNTT